MNLLTSTLKLILIFVFSYVLRWDLYTPNKKHPLVNGLENFFTKDYQFLYTFITQVLCAWISYLGTWMACKVNLQKSCFVIPFFLSTPVTIFLVSPLANRNYGTCDLLLLMSCPNEGAPVTWQTILLGLCLWVSGFVFSIQFFKSQQFLMAKEEFLFWLPCYDGVFVEQFLLLNRKNEMTGK